MLVRDLKRAITSIEQLTTRGVKSAYTVQITSVRFHFIDSFSDGLFILYRL
jgi:hypothetical protein